MKSAVFDRYAEYYDLLYRDKDYETETRYVAHVLELACPNARTLLEFGTGTGRHAELLRSYGFGIQGVDWSESMVNAARARGLDCVQEQIQRVRLDRVFDGVIALFHVMSYQISDQAVADAFANAARHLRPDGVFLFDVWHAPAVAAQGLSTRVKRVEDNRVRITRTAEPQIGIDSQIATICYTFRVQSKTDGQVQHFQETHCMRSFFPAEIGQFARRSGFDVERSEEWVTGNLPSENTWGVCYLLRKQNEPNG